MIPRNALYLCAMGVLFSGCGTKPIKPSSQHILQSSLPVAAAESIPPAIINSVVLPPPQPVAKVDTYSVVVTNVSAQEILFALARDAKINLDVHPGIEGAVTINAIDQTLPQILSRIAKQVDMRYELDNGTLIVMPDSPYLHNYKIDYVNMSRDSEATMSNATQVGSSASGSAVGTGGAGGNNSSLKIQNTSKNHFWETLTQNIKDILRETDKVLPNGSSETLTQQVSSKSGIVAKAKKTNSKNANSNLDGTEPIDVEEEGTTVTRRSTFREAASVIANPENGLITVRATSKQHEKIQEFVDQVMVNAQRQVLIEATIVEVRLSDNYQQGIDWSRLRLGNKGFNISQVGTGTLAATKTGNMFTLGYLNPTSALGNLTANISLLESFGKVKVLSSPKLSVMNNQTAMLRVVDNLVYFVISATTTAPTTTSSAFSTFTTTPNTVPIGFTMSVTPQINDSDSVLLNLRPSISRLLGYVNDPNPTLAGAGVVSRVPQTQTREMESVLRIENNQTAVLGGLMEDRVDKTTDEVPFMASVPILGNLFQNRNDTTTKTELVIFLRPVVIKDASLNGDYNEFRDNLPDNNFFKESANGKPSLQ
ncbi:MAG: pilus (MSHA type) biogenesis protein MshL [Gallionella sp.]